jgi:ABC-type glycerol-3-phosphate transport system substrate-binding protein
MKHKHIPQLLAAGALALGVPVAQACDFKNEVPVSMLSAGFEAWKVVTGAMAECGNFQPELDQEFRTKQPAAMAANPSQYTMGGVANSTVIPLLNDGSIRALDDLIAKHAPDLPAQHRFVIDGKVMAIPMMVNAQHLMYRKDIFADLGIAEPKTYADVLQAADRIQAAGVVDYPLGGTYKAGWNLAQEFVNIYLGFDGKFVDDRNQPSVNNEQGKRALRLMRELSKYMDPEYLVSDSTYVQKQFQQGKIAMANLWASRAGALENPEESKVAGLVEFSAAPAAVNGGEPATTLWWDGLVIAKNITDEEADAAFRLLLAGLDSEVLAANKDAAIWLDDSFAPSAIGKGAAASSAGGAPRYPSSTAMGLMHTALGNNIADFLTGEEDAEQTLADIEAEYTVAAKEKGLI